MPSLRVFLRDFYTAPSGEGMPWIAVPPPPKKGGTPGLMTWGPRFVVPLGTASEAGAEAPREAGGVPEGLEPIGNARQDVLIQAIAAHFQAAEGGGPFSFQAEGHGRGLEVGVQEPCEGRPSGIDQAPIDAGI